MPIYVQWANIDSYSGLVNFSVFKGKILLQGFCIRLFYLQVDAPNKPLLSQKYQTTLPLAQTITIPSFFLVLYTVFMKYFQWHLLFLISCVIWFKYWRIPNFFLV